MSPFLFIQKPSVILSAAKDPVFCGTALVSTGFFVATLLRMTAGLPPLKGEVPAEQAEGLKSCGGDSMRPPSLAGARQPPLQGGQGLSLAGARPPQA